MTAEQIIVSLRRDEHSKEELYRIDGALHHALNDRLTKDDGETADAPPSQLVPDWSLYVPDEGDFNGRRKYDAAVMELNTAGRNLIVAIRQTEFTMEARNHAIHKGFEKIAKLQDKHASLGAADTEGREALWELVQRACKGTERDPELIWNKNYK